jgi:hypothetical protein
MVVESFVSNALLCVVCVRPIVQTFVRIHRNLNTNMIDKTVWHAVPKWLFSGVCSNMGCQMIAATERSHTYSTLKHETHSIKLP